MTKPKRYLWSFTFIDANKGKIATAEAGSEDYVKLQKDSNYFVGSATLIDKKLSSTLKVHILHYVPLEPSSVIRVFTRVEHNLVNSTISRIPAFSYKKLNKTDADYCFAYRERVIYTSDKNFHTVELSSLEA
jgi:hypothetical protein